LHAEALSEVRRGARRRSTLPLARPDKDERVGMLTRIRAGTRAPADLLARILRKGGSLSVSSPAAQYELLISPTSSRPRPPPRRRQYLKGLLGELNLSGGLTADAHRPDTDSTGPGSPNKGTCTTAAAELKIAEEYAISITDCCSALEESFRTDLAGGGQAPVHRQKAQPGT
jgi:hypothetical protein